MKRCWASLIIGRAFWLILNVADLKCSPDVSMQTIPFQPPRSALKALRGGPARWLPALGPSLLGTVTDSCFFGSDKVQALSYAQHTRQLISCGGDGGIVVWNMDGEAGGFTAGPRATLPWPPGWALHLWLLRNAQPPPAHLFFFWLCFSLVASSWGCLRLRAGFSLQWLLYERAFGHSGFSSCGTRALEHRPSWLWCTGAELLRRMRRFRTGIEPLSPAWAGRLYHWTTGEAHFFLWENHENKTCYFRKSENNNSKIKYNSSMKGASFISPYKATHNTHAVEIHKKTEYCFVQILRLL